MTDDDLTAVCDDVTTRSDDVTGWCDVVRSNWLLSVVRRLVTVLLVVAEAVELVGWTVRASVNERLLRGDDVRTDELTVTGDVTAMSRDDGMDVLLTGEVVTADDLRLLVLLL